MLLALSALSALSARLKAGQETSALPSCGSRGSLIQRWPMGDISKGQGIACSCVHIENATAFTRGSSSILTCEIQARYSHEVASRAMPESVSASSLTPSVQRSLAGVQSVQQRDTLLRVNAIADRCFNVCVDDFGFTKLLRSGEEECLRRCVDKYLLLASGTGSSFAEHLSGPTVPQR